MLTSLEIKNFRTFSHLFIERLGRVNLILGKNNVGKTTLLEALRLYGSIWPPSTVASILHERNEISRSAQGKTLLLLHSLFHQRQASQGAAIRIGQAGANEETRAFVATARTEPERIGQSNDATPAAYDPGGSIRLSIQSAQVHFTVSADGHATWGAWSETRKPLKPPFDPPCLRGVGIRGDLDDPIARWWDALSLTQAERRVVDALHYIAPIHGVRFVGDPRTSGGRMGIARVEGLDEPVALATLGDGVVRMFQLAVALEYAAVYARSAAEGEYRSNVFPMLLIDEVEAGIHHTLHADLWRFIFRAARLLDVQVFATTHSWDCLKGFAEAIAEDEQNDGLAIRLEKVEGEEQTGAVIVDREGVPIVVRDSIEVR